MAGSEAGVSVEEIVTALTWVRTQPKDAAAMLRTRLPHYKGKEYSPPEREGSSIVTKEGKAVVEEAIAYLEKLEPLSSLGTTSDVALGLAAEDHVADIGSTGVVSHSSSDGTCAADRVSRYGKFRSTGESLWYGSSKATAQSLVLDLVVDDGVATRGHRLCVCDPKWEIVGVFYGRHATFGYMVAMEFAKGWAPDEAAVEARRASGPPAVKGQEEAKQSVQTQWKLGACLVCHEEIKGGAVMEIEKLNGKVHKDCFNCKSCSKSLKGVPWQAQDSCLYCKSCHAEQFGERCTSCSKAIEGGMVKCALGKFHVECVICSTCKKAIGKASFSTAGGVISCQACATQKARSASVGRVAGVMPASTDALSKAGSAVTSAGRSASKTSEPSLAGPAGPAGPAGSGSVGHSLGHGPTAAAGAAMVAAPKGKAKAKPKAKAKASLHQAGVNVVGLGMDYASLA